MRLSLQVRLLGLATLLLALVPSITLAEEVPTRFFDGAAREMVSHLESGNGWAVVSERQMINLNVLGQSAEAVKYRIVNGFTKGTTSNGQFYVEVTYGLETPPILTELKLPTVSGPSLTLAKQANEAVAQLDTLIPQLEAGIAAEENAELRNIGNQLLGALRSQRSALADLISKDIQSVGMTK